MPPLPYRPRDIVRVPASVNQTLHTFFHNNSHLPTISGITQAKKSSTPAPDVSPSSGHNQPKSVPVRPGVILDVSPDHATIAMFTTLNGATPSDIKGLLRLIIAAILPVNGKRDPTASDGLPTFAVHPTWRVLGDAEPSLSQLCLCLKHRVPINELEPWSWKDEPNMVGERFKMCRADFKALQQLCERNEHLRGLFASEISWLFQELRLDDIVKRHSG
jgi:hypothetical protein